MKRKRGWKLQWDREGREHLALPTREMRILVVLLAGQNDDEDMISQVVARRAGITRNEKCVYVVLRRLRDRGFVKTIHFRALGGNGNNCLFARHELTAAGRVVAAAWELFLRKLGPRLRRHIGW